MFPSADDGLIPVQRRILLGAYTVARTSFVKTSNLLGTVMAKWHPHSEQVGTVQWAVQNGFLDGNGWWGSRLGVEPTNCAAPRYTSVKLSKFTYELAFKNVDFVKWEPDELEPEPIYLPTLVPFSAICKYVQSLMGFGYRTVQPVFRFADIVKRLYNNNYVPKPRLIGAECVSSIEQVKRLFTHSEPVRLTFRPKTIVEEQEQSVYVLSCPEFPFKQMIKRLGTLWSSGEVGYIELPVDKKHRKELDKDETIYFKFTPTKKSRQIFDKLVKICKTKLDFTITFVNTLYDMQLAKSVVLSFDEYINRVYSNYKKAYQTGLTAAIDKYKATIKELDIIESIRPYVSRVRLTQDTETIIRFLADKTKYSQEEISQVVSKYSIRSLLSNRKDKVELLAKVKQLEEARQDLERTIRTEVDRLVQLRESQDDSKA